jgi:acyl-coenzyme A thioesterase PaaI-like protein
MMITTRPPTIAVIIIPAVEELDESSVGVCSGGVCVAKIDSAGVCGMALRVAQVSSIVEGASPTEQLIVVITTPPLAPPHEESSK